MSQATAHVERDMGAKSQEWYPKSSPPGSLAKGKKFWVVPLTTSIPTLADYANGFKNAAEALGADVTIFDGKFTPSVIAQGVNAAVAAKADGIVTILVDPALIAPALKAAADAGIPVISGNAGPAAPPFPAGVTGKSAQDQNRMGQMTADYALKATNCELNTTVITSNGNAAADATYDGIVAEVKDLCPGCVVQELDVQPQDVATKTQSRLQNALQRNPDTNMVMMVADPYLPYVTKALRTLGSDIPVTTTTSMGNLVGTAEGTPVVAASNYAPGLVHGWYQMTAMLHALNGETDVAVQYPVGLVDKSNRDPDDPSSFSGTSPYADYQSEFKKLWGITG